MSIKVEPRDVAALLDEQARAALKIPFPRYIPHLPTEKQLKALRADTTEILYGGAAGGGKSDWLLMGALQYADEPNYAALLLRRTYADLSLPKALMDRARDWLSTTDAHWDDREKTWRFPSGATLTFGYLENENDKYRYQSSEFQFIGFDEVTQFTESQYLYLFSRLRRLMASDIPLRMRCAGNPDGVGFAWVKKRFITEKDRTRLFVPARLDDNPFLDRKSYEESLEKLDPFTRARLREGSWDERQGTEILRSWFEFVPRLPEGVQEQCRALDLALTLKQTQKSDPDYFADIGSAMYKGWLYLVYPRHRRLELPDIESEIENYKRAHPHVRLGAAKDLAAKALRQALERRGIYMEEYEEAKDLRARLTTFVNWASRGLVKLVGTKEEWDEFMDEATAFPNGAHDDLLAACAGLTQMHGLVITAPALPKAPKRGVAQAAWRMRR